MPIKTPLVRINSASGLEKTVRVMFDDGSENTWTRKGLADELRLDGAKETVVVATFRQIVGKPVTSHKVEFSLADPTKKEIIGLKSKPLLLMTLVPL